MKINILNAMRGVLMLVAGVGVNVTTIDIANSWQGMPRHATLLLIVSGTSLLLVGAIELLCILYRLGMRDIGSTSNVEEARRLAVKALYYEFAPFFKSGNNIPVPNANVPGDLGRKVSEVLLDYATKK